METRLCKILKTTNTAKFIKAIPESPHKIYKVQIRPQAAHVVFRGRLVLSYFWNSDWHNFAYVLGKVAKLFFLESPRKSLYFVSLNIA